MAAGHVKAGVTRAQVRKAPRWRSSWANIRLCTLPAGFPPECPGKLASLWASANALLAAVRGVVRGHALRQDRLLAARLAALHDAGMLAQGGSGGPPGPPGSRDCEGFRPISYRACVLSAGSLLSLSPLAERELSPQAR
jgi:hypothetical protein